MANKFLGLDSINVLKEYIDSQISDRVSNTGVTTIYAYKYSSGMPTTPSGGGFDTIGVSFSYPEGWNSLKILIGNKTEEELEEYLANGSIWLSVGVSINGNEFEWSNPIKISGQNGVSVSFKYSYNENSLESERTDTPSGVNSENRIEYVWTRFGNSNWQGPTIWAMYSVDASDVLYRYCTTDEFTTPNKPMNNNDSGWSNSISNSLSNDRPLMWMSWKRVAAGSESNSGIWSEPILFGRYGKDGQDGNVPDYTFTLYAAGAVDAIPTIPIFTENTSVEEFKSINSEIWKDIPENTNDVWYQCTIKVNGIENVVTEIGAIKRYSAVDGTAIPGKFTMYLYKWSDTQDSPEFVINENEWKPADWNELPDVNSIEHPEASLWMISAVIDGYNTDTAIPNIESGWSNPIKITGPRGPISYDYRVETRYEIGTRENPRYIPSQNEWSAVPPMITSDYPYIWAASYLVCYKMKYADNPNEDGIYPIVQDGLPISVTHITDGIGGYYRLSGVNGENGNKINSLDYLSGGNTNIPVDSFTSKNVYISNSSESITYNINLLEWAFINGATAKFANIGTGEVVINSVNSEVKFNNNCNEFNSFTLLSGETVEVICYTTEDNIKKLIVIGKQLQ